MMKRTGTLLLTLLLTSPASIAADRVATTLENGLLFRLVEPEKIHRMEQPGFVSLALAQGFMGEFEPVVGVTDGEHAKAYSAWLMEGYSVINDKLGDRPMVVTWSPFSLSNTVWDRTVEGEVLEFEDSGELWNDALVMVDKQTGSRWSHLLGRALDGPYKGQQLVGLVSSYTTWGKWRSLYPATVALTKLGRDLEGSDFERYYSRTEQLGPANSKNPDSRLVGKELICGFFVNETPVAVPLYALVENKQFKLNVNGVLLEIEFDHLAETAVVYSRELAGEPVELVRLDFGKGESYLKEKASGTTWLTYSGRGVSGPRSNLVLKRLPSTLCFWFVWAQHYPLTLIWETPGSESMP